MKGWKRLWKHAQRPVVSTVAELEHIEPTLPGLKDLNLRVLFLSDLHYRGPEPWHDDLRLLCSQIDPDLLIFGGDLTAAYDYDGALDLIAELPARVDRLLVPGNWDYFERFRVQFPDGTRTVQEKCEARRLRFVSNGWVDYPGLSIYGADDAKAGSPAWNPGTEPLPTGNKVCIVTHNPYALSGPWQTLGKVDLCLCGHTHAGQIRLPILGAIRTSSKAGRFFDYGGYEHVSGTVMMISSGVGATLFNKRIRCPREIVTFGKESYEKN